MATMGVHHGERKIRVNVVDQKRGVDAWVPLYVYAAHQLMSVSSFCQVRGDEGEMRDARQNVCRWLVA